MNAFTIHPGVYATGEPSSLLRMLEEVWVRGHTPGAGILYIVSGFGTYNGGVRFYQTFKQHIERGGRVISFFSGSTSQKLTSKQLVQEMLNVGAQVHVVNRKRLLHAKCYGTSTPEGDRLIVTSGNFTGPGLSLNVEASLLLDRDSTRVMGFSWSAVLDNLLRQRWDLYRPRLGAASDPVWQLLYDETERGLVLDETEESTLLVTLGHSDTARIQASEGTDAGKGTQYFWLSRDCYGFFPPLTIRNQRGAKATFSCIVTMHYVDLQVTDAACRVTFEAENNLDFRLGTSPLRHTRAAAEGDIAAISRIKETEYELRLFRAGSALFVKLAPYAVTFIGNQGKKYGYLSNEDFCKVTGIRLPADISAFAN